MTEGLGGIQEDATQEVVTWKKHGARRHSECTAWILIINEEHTLLSHTLVFVIALTTTANKGGQIDFFWGIEFYSAAAGAFLTIPNLNSEQLIRISPTSQTPLDCPSLPFTVGLANL